MISNHLAKKTKQHTIICQVIGVCLKVTFCEQSSFLVMALTSVGRMIK